MVRPDNLAVIWSKELLAVSQLQHSIDFLGQQANEYWDFNNKEPDTIIFPSMQVDQYRGVELPKRPQSQILFEPAR